MVKRAWKQGNWTCFFVVSVSERLLQFKLEGSFRLIKPGWSCVLGYPITNMWVSHIYEWHLMIISHLPALCTQKCSPYLTISCHLSTKSDERVWERQRSMWQIIWELSFRSPLLIDTPAEAFHILNTDGSLLGQWFLLWLMQNTLGHSDHSGYNQGSAEQYFPDEHCPFSLTRSQQSSSVKPITQKIMSSIYSHGLLLHRINESMAVPNLHVFSLTHMYLLI